LPNADDTSKRRSSALLSVWLSEERKVVIASPGGGGGSSRGDAGSPREGFLPLGCTGIACEPASPGVAPGLVSSSGEEGRPRVYRYRSPTGVRNPKGFERKVFAVLWFYYIVGSYVIFFSNFKNVPT
jgi:hypothetical protein